MEFEKALKNKQVNESALHHISLDKGRSLNTNNLNDREKEDCSTVQ